MKCRICESRKIYELIDFGSMPPANSLKLNSDSNILKEYELLLQYCPECHNLQLSECVDNEE